jgi:hypothetical protein
MLEKSKLNLLTFYATAKTLLSGSDKIALTDSDDNNKLKSCTFANFISSITTFLKLDQTTPQTVANGKPIFSAGIATTTVKTDTTTPTDLSIETGAGKTMVLNTVVYNDINTGLNPRNTGTGRPTLDTLSGNLKEFRFAVDDYVDLVPIELLHDWKEGTPVEFHVHWVMNTANDATIRGVKWELEYGYANMGGVYTFPAAASNETSIAANEVAFTHKYTSVVTFTPATSIGTQLSMRLKRIASVTNVAPATNPFVLSTGVHYQKDTMGSRAISAK